MPDQPDRSMEPEEPATSGVDDPEADQAHGLEGSEGVGSGPGGAELARRAGLVRDHDEDGPFPQEGPHPGEKEGEPDPGEPDPGEPRRGEGDEPAPDEEDLDPDLDPGAEDRPRKRRPARRGRAGAGEPAWRAAVRGSRFGQVAVVLVAAFAIAIAAWWAVKPEDERQAEGEAADVTQVEVEGAQAAPVAGSRAPAFTGTDIGSQEVSLDPDNPGGKPVWLMFVATWCTGCRTEMPDVQEAVAAYGQDVEVIVVYVGEDRATVSAYSGRVGNSFTEVPDTSQSIAAAYGVMGVPSHFFIDADGTVRQVSVGMLTPDEMAQSLRELTGS